MGIVAHVLTDGRCQRLTELDPIVAALRDERAIVWVDIDEKNHDFERFLAAELGIHPMAIEDIYSVRLTPKVEDYGGYLYIVMHGVQSEGFEIERLRTVELDLVLGRRWLLTHHSDPMRSIDETALELERNPRLLERGVALVAHAVIDRLTDQYLPVADRYQEEIDELERMIIEKPTEAYLARLFAMKRSLQRLRRISAYQRDLLLRLSRDEFALIPPAALPFFRDVYDHFVRIADLADSYRDLVTSALEIYMSVVANRTNDVMRVLTLISTIMLPLTFIAGVYGMNFEHMPELHWEHGYPLVILLMFTVALGMVWLFRRRGWL